MSNHMKQPCIHCPFRHDVEPFLTPERGEELAYSALNPYNSFPCHKTTVYDEDTESMECGNETKECAGFIELQHFLTGCDLPKGYKLSGKVYEDEWEMVSAYEDENKN